MEYVTLNNGIKMPKLGYGVYGVYQTPAEDTKRCVLDAIEESMRKLQTEYLDLLLIHQPFGDYYGTYRAMEELYKEGKLRAIGVSNFGPDHYLDIQHFAEIEALDGGESLFFSHYDPKTVELFISIL